MFSMDEMRRSIQQEDLVTFRAQMEALRQWDYEFALMLAKSTVREACTVSPAVLEFLLQVWTDIMNAHPKLATDSNVVLTEALMILEGPYTTSFKSVAAEFLVMNVDRHPDPGVRRALLRIAACQVGSSTEVGNLVGLKLIETREAAGKTALSLTLEPPEQPSSLLPVPA